MEVFEIIIVPLFHSKVHFIWLILHFKNTQKCLISITNKNNKDDDKKWPYRMLIIGPSGSGKTNALLNSI